MAAAARELRYQDRNMVYGDLAYDLDRAVLERNLRHAGEAPRHQEAQLRAASAPQVRSVEKPLVRERQRISFLSVAGAAVAIAMALLLLLNYVKLTELSTGMVSLRREMETLKSEEVTLTAQYEQMYDLATVKEAAEQAGMTRPGSSQIYYLDLSGGDSAVVYQKSAPNVLTRVMTSLNHGIYSVMEYFD